MSIKVRPISLREANAFVQRLHRHHKPTVGHKFSLSAWTDLEVLVGVVIAGRPVARGIDYTKVLEVTRLCTDGTKNVCSLLYAAAARVGREMGYERIQTYILDSEPGTSLLAAGWTMTCHVKGRDWNCPSRGGRRTDQPMVNKQRWEKQLNRGEEGVVAWASLTTSNSG